MMGRIWREHSLTIVIVVVLVVQTVYFLIAGYYFWTYDAKDSGMPFWLWWTTEYNLSVVADVWGALFLVHTTKKFHEKGSPESGDDQDE